MFLSRWSVNLVVALATAVAILDVFFILVAVPESLPEKVRISQVPSSLFPLINYSLFLGSCIPDKLGTSRSILVVKKCWRRRNNIVIMYCSIFILSTRSRPIQLYFRLFKISNGLECSNGRSIRRISWFISRPIAIMFRSINEKFGL